MRFVVFQTDFFLAMVEAEVGLCREPSSNDSKNGFQNPTDFLDPSFAIYWYRHSI